MSNSFIELANEMKKTYSNKRELSVKKIDFQEVVYDDPFSSKNVENFNFGNNGDVF